jgi:hypothetical protein
MIMAVMIIQLILYFSMLHQQPNGQIQIQHEADGNDEVTNSVELEQEKQPTTSPYPEPTESTPTPHPYPESILPSMPWSSEWSLSFLIDLICLLIFWDEYKLRNSPLCN